MRQFGKRVLAAAALAAGLAGNSRAEPFELRSGIDMFLRDQSAISSLHYLSMMKELGGGFYVGQTLYSAAGGDGGGLFIGGVEAFKRFQITGSTSLDLGGFVGGGGGAVVVLGDGLMTKGQITLNQAFASGWAASLGAGWTRVTGSAINTPVISFGLSRQVDLALTAGHVGPRPAEGTIIGAVKGVGRYYYPISSSRRNGAGEMNPMGLVGAEFTFNNLADDRHEVFMSAVGAMAGDGAGYAEWLLGARWFTAPFAGGRMRGFADLGVGFAGGGDVDTGGGLVGAASAGVDVALFRGLHAEGGVMGIGALGGDFRAAGGFVRAALRFDDPAANVSGVEGGAARHWRVATGVSYQFAHPGYRPPGHQFTGSSPLLFATDIDLLVGDHFYVTGSAQTVVDGNAGGFAMGTVGIGWEQALGANWALSGEVFAGAAAGGGINTGGGVIGGLKAEIDYALTDRLRLSAGVGKWYSLGGARPWTLQAGLKIPFTTFHGR